MATELRMLGKTWWTDFHHEGKRVRKSTGSADKKEAQRFLIELKASLYNQPKFPGGSWDDALIKWLKEEERSDSDKYSITKLGYKNRKLEDCTVEGFTKILDGMSLAPATYNRYIARIAAVLNLSDVRLKFKKKPVGKGRIRFLTKDEWDKLYSVLPEHLKPLALFAITTGLRQHNVTHLRWTEVDISRKVMWVHPDEAKGGSAICIPLAEKAIPILLAQKDKDTIWVFPYKGRGKTEAGPLIDIKKAWQLAMERAGLGHFKRWTDAEGKQHVKWIGDFTWHGLRHTWASWHVMSGTPLEVLQQLGGWEDPRMVQNYAHLAPGYISKFADNSTPWTG